MASDQSDRPPYTFSVGVLDEIDEFVNVFELAFRGNDPVYRAMFPGGSTDHAGAQAFQKADNLLSYRYNENVTWGKTTRVDTGEVAAVGKWRYCDGKYAKKEPDPDEQPRWEGKNDDSIKLFTGLQGEYQKRIMGSKPHYYVDIIATSPKHQGKGAISLVMRHIIAEAAVRNIPVYIEGSAMGVPVYKHFGFNEVDKIKVDFPSGIHAEVTVMIKEIDK